jgi:hypothetical protein
MIDDMQRHVQQFSTHTARSAHSMRVVRPGFLVGFVALGFYLAAALF